MKRFGLHVTISALLLISMEVIADQKKTCPPEYYQALEAVHLYSLGTGDESLTKAMGVANLMSKSHPLSGCGQTIMSEVFSTWMIDKRGQPTDRRRIGMAYA